MSRPARTIRGYRPQPLLRFLLLAGAAVPSWPLAAAEPVLIQLPDTAGCINEGGTGGCGDFHHLVAPNGIDVSPDGRNLYLTTSGSDALLAFNRDLETGELTAKPLLEGCIAEIGVPMLCADGVALDLPTAVVVSPDGRNLYVASTLSSAVAVFDRNEGTGALLQKGGTDACISDDGTGGSCVNGTALLNASGVAVSPDGMNVYVTAVGDDAIAVFDRDPATGELTQKAGTDGCVSETGTAGACVDGKALVNPVAVTVSPNGRSVYVASLDSDAIAVFDRDVVTGELTQKAGTAGCVSETGTGGTCIDDRALDLPRDVKVSRDGGQVYATAEDSAAIVVFDRNPMTGALTQRPGIEGCTSESGTGGQCADGKALLDAVGLALSPDGRSAYVAAVTADAVAVFDRHPGSGDLIQKSGTAGCISDDGTGGSCADGRALSSAVDAVVSPDGHNVYLLSGAGAVVVFDREPDAYDIDGDNEVEALTDALLLLRYAFGFRGAVLITGAVNLVSCTRCTAPDIEAFIAAIVE